MINFLFLKAPPRIRLAQGPTYAKTGQNVTLPNCHVTGFPTPVITWTRPAGPLAKERVVQDGVLLTVGLAAKHDIGYYVCHAKNHLGQRSAVTSLVVISLPKFVTKPPQMIIQAPGDELSLSCSAKGDPTPVISWKRSKGTWEGKRMEVNEGTLKISALNENDFGIYICEAKVPYYTIETRTELTVKG